MKVIEIIGNQYLRILALEETLGQREVQISLLQEKVMRLTPQVKEAAPVETGDTRLHDLHPSGIL